MDEVQNKPKEGNSTFLFPHVVLYVVIIYFLKCCKQISLFKHVEIPSCTETAFTTKAQHFENSAGVVNNATVPSCFSLLP
jgi:hypothetical protein